MHQLFVNLIVMGFSVWEIDIIFTILHHVIDYILFIYETNVDKNETKETIISLYYDSYTIIPSSRVATGSQMPYYYNY